MSSAFIMGMRALQDLPNVSVSVYPELITLARQEGEGEPNLGGSSEADRATQSGGGGVALCTMTRDQHDDLLEWVEHHLSMGVRRIYLYDDKSTPPLLARLLDHVKVGCGWGWVQGEGLRVGVRF